MIRVVLFDRDDTLIQNIHDLRDPRSIIAMPTAAQSLALLRSHGLVIGVVTNQPRIAHGMLTSAELDEHHAHIERLIGPIDRWFVCPHAEHEGCLCRKPAPALVLQAARAFGVMPNECVVVGDIGSDIEAARRAGAAAILVPTTVTLQREIDDAPIVANHVLHAVQIILEARTAGTSEIPDRPESIGESLRNASRANYV